MRICFIGCVQSSYVLLQALLEHRKQVVGVITRRESKFNADFHSLIPLCEEENVPFICEDEINEKELIDFIKKSNPDVIYCFGWSKLLPNEILDIPAMGGIGFHPAELPLNRGRHPLIWALVLGLKKTASTFFKMTEEADAGDIISQCPIDIDYEDDAHTLYQKVLETAANQLLQFTEYAEKTGEFPYIKVNEGGNLWRKRDKNDGQIDWRMYSESIYNLVRALTHPYVGAHFSYKDIEYKVWKVQVWQEPIPNNIEPGKILQINSMHDFIIKTGDGAIRVLDCDDVVLEEGGYLS